MPEFAANFTAIDFETANHRRDSACQLAAVRVRDGKVADSAMWMIRPKPFFFTRANIRIHGITPAQVAGEPEFGELWDEISAAFGDDCLVAHNAGFDIGVLLECLRRHRIPIPQLQYTCTRAIARSAWPNRRRYGLKPLADWLGVRFNHHDALEDSIACAKVLLAAGIEKQASSLGELEKKLRLKRGEAGTWGHRGPSGSRWRRVSPAGQASQRKQSHNVLPPSSKSVAEATSDYDLASSPAATFEIDLQRLLVRADFIRPLSGKNVVFAGKLRSLSDDDAHRLASRAGGDCQQNVDSRTSLLIVGSAESIGENVGRIDQEQSEATRLQSEGRAIQILSEEEFLGLVIAQPPESF